jgi:hypothetical protein
VASAETGKSSFIDVAYPALLDSGLVFCRTYQSVCISREIVSDSRLLLFFRALQNKKRDAVPLVKESWFDM